MSALSPGIKFYEEVGCLSIGEAGDDFISTTYNSAVEQGIAVVKLSDVQLKTRFPYLGMDPTSSAILEVTAAGYINPRRVCAAQQKLAELRGCRIIRDIVRTIDAVATGSDDGMVKVVTDTGREIFARKVLLATGAFSAFRRILPRNVRPDLTALTQSVIFAELSPKDLARLRYD